MMVELRSGVRMVPVPGVTLPGGGGGEQRPERGQDGAGARGDPAGGRAAWGWSGGRCTSGVGGDNNTKPPSPPHPVLYSQAPATNLLRRLSRSSTKPSLPVAFDELIEAPTFGE